MTTVLAIDTDALAERIERATREGYNVTVTPDEFQALRDFAPLSVVHPATGIWKDLGILGYIGKIPLFDAFKWNARPFEPKPHAFD